VTDAAVPFDLDRLRQLGKAAITRRQAVSGAAVSTLQPPIAKEHLRARSRRATFACAAWIAGASQSQIASCLAIRPQTVASLLKANLPYQLRREIASSRARLGRELIRFDQAEQMRNLFEQHQEWGEADLTTVTERFSRIEGDSLTDPDSDKKEA